MYNSKQLEPFFNKVHKEASEAAQKVYDKYENELIKRVKAQMFKGHKIISGMGTAFVDNKQGEKVTSYDNSFDAVLTDNTQYHNKVEAGFYLPSLLIKE